MRFVYLLVISLYFTIGLSAKEASNRSVAMGYDEELQKVYKQGLEAEGVSRRNYFNKLVRVGKDKLIQKDENLYVNARDFGLNEIIKQEAQEDARAEKYLDRAEDDADKLIKVVERYPHSLSAVEALKKIAKMPQASAVFRQWRVLIEGRSEAAVLYDLGDEGKTSLPASEIQPEKFAFPKIPNKALSPYMPSVARTQGFVRYSFNHKRIEYLFPLDSICIDGKDIILSNHKGSMWFEKVKQGREVSFTERCKYTVPSTNGMLSWYDNNIVADFTKVGRRVYTSHRDTPMKYDTQKNLYIVELSRHKMMGFDLKSDDEEKSKPWKAAWTLRDKNKTFNAPLVASSGKGYLTSTTFQGLFNVELNQINLNTGEMKWSAKLSSGSQELNYFGRQTRECLAGVPLLHDKRLYVSSNVGLVHCVDDSGRVIWSRRYNRIAPTQPIKFRPYVAPRIGRFRNQMPQIQEDRVYFSPLDSNDLICVNAKTGEKIWSKKFQLNIFYFSDDFSSDFDKKIHWRVGDEGVTVFNHGHILRLDAKTGKVLFRRDLATELSSVPLYFKDNIACAAEDHIFIFNKKDLKLQQKIRLRVKNKSSKNFNRSDVRMISANMAYSNDYLLVWGLYVDQSSNQWHNSPGLLYLVKLDD